MSNERDSTSLCQRNHRCSRSAILIRYAQERNVQIDTPSGASVSVADGAPVEVRWSFPDDSSFPEEWPALAGVIEGAKRQVTVNAYERDPTAKPRCVKRWGTKCVVCGFDFVEVYGELGEGFIHVHHLTLIHTIGEAYKLDPEADLRPVCPNCHAMLHRRKEVLSIAELQAMLRRRFSGV